MLQTLMGFPTYWLNDFRWPQEMSRLLDELATPSYIRSVPRGSFPTINVGATADAVHVFAFAPGIDPQSIDVSFDNGLLVIAGERKSPEETENNGVSRYKNERFFGKFRRVVTLSDDIDPEKIDASYQDGVLQVTARKREAAVPRRIQVN